MSTVPGKLIFLPDNFYFQKHFLTPRIKIHEKEKYTFICGCLNLCCLDLELAQFWSHMVPMNVANLIELRSLI